MRSKTKRTEPVAVKAMSFTEMMESVAEKEKLFNTRFATGLCVSMVNDGKDECQNPHTGADGLCDSCRDELDKLLTELSKSKGFFGIRVGKA